MPETTEQNRARRLMPDQLNDIPPRYRGCLHDSLDQAARRHAGKTAIVTGDRSCSFLELHNWAERLADHLVSLCRTSKALRVMLQS